MIHRASSADCSGPHPRIARETTRWPIVWPWSSTTRPGNAVHKPKPNNCWPRFVTAPADSRKRYNTVRSSFSCWTGPEPEICCPSSRPARGGHLVGRSQRRPRPAGQSGDLVRDALRIPNGKQQRDPTWESQVRLQWAKALFAAGSRAPALVLYREAAEAARHVLRQIEQRDIAAKHRAAATEVFVQGCLRTGRLLAAEQALQAAPCHANGSPRSNRNAPPTRRRMSSVVIDKRETEHLTRALRKLPRDGGHPSSQEAQLCERLAAIHEQQAQRDTDHADAAAGPITPRMGESGRRLCSAVQPQRANGVGEFESISNLQHALEIYIRMEMWKKALPAAERLLQSREQTLLEDDPRLFQATTALGICHAQSDRSAEAKQQLQRALVFWLDYQPMAKKELAETLQNLAEVARKDGDYPTAQQHLAALMRILESGPVDNTGLMECHITRGNVFSCRVTMRRRSKNSAAEDAATRHDGPAANALTIVS